MKRLFARRRRCLWCRGTGEAQWFARGCVCIRCHGFGYLGRIPGSPDKPGAPIAERN